MIVNIIIAYTLALLITEFYPLQELLVKAPNWMQYLAGCWVCLGFWLALVLSLSLLTACSTVLLIKLTLWIETKLPGN